LHCILRKRTRLIDRCHARLLARLLRRLGKGLTRDWTTLVRRLVEFVGDLLAGNLCGFVRLRLAAGRQTKHASERNSAHLDHHFAYLWLGFETCTDYAERLD
jgi:hypothetical protein